MPSQWVVSLGNQLVHTIRNDNKTWQQGWGDVFGQVGLAPGIVVEIASHTDLNGNLQLVLRTEDNKLWHTVRYADGHWQDHWGDVYVEGGVGSPPPLPPSTVRCMACSVSGDNSFQISLLLADLRTIVHTLRNGDGSGWQQFWGNVNGQVGPLPGDAGARFFYGG